VFVIHAALFWAASGMLDGFAVDGFEAALIGSVYYSLLCIVIDSALEQLFPPQRLN
jgi:putative membrane protein